MRIVIAPDSFKESISAADAAAAIRRGIERAARARGATIECDECPVADGGEGTVAAVARAVNAEIRTARVTGPLGEPVDAEWALWSDADGGRCAIIETASAAGLHLVPREKRNPDHTTTFGLGELIRVAIEAGTTTIFVGLGGSATVDGGIGMAQALGVQIDGVAELSRPLTGKNLNAITAVRTENSIFSRAPNPPRIRVMCDVENPLCGPTGAAHTYGPQKGAIPEQVRRFDAGLANLARCCACANLPADPRAPGAGAAGGLGFGLMAFVGAALEPGAKLILDTVSFADRLARADVVITGEGRLDATSFQGKVVGTVARAAQRDGVPCIAFAGAIDAASLAPHIGPGRPLSEARLIAPRGTPVEESVKSASRFLESAAEKWANSALK